MSRSCSSGAHRGSFLAIALVGLCTFDVQCGSSPGGGAPGSGGSGGSDGTGGAGLAPAASAPTCPTGAEACGANRCCPADHPVCCPDLLCATDASSCRRDGGGGTTVGPVAGTCPSQANQCEDGSCCPDQYPVCCAGTCAADECPGGQLPNGVVNGPRCGEQCARASGSLLYYTYSCGSLGTGSQSFGYDSGYQCGVASDDPSNGVSFTAAAVVDGVYITDISWTWGDYVMGGAPNGIVPPETCGDYTSSKRFISLAGMSIENLLIVLPSTTFLLNLYASSGCSFWVCAECDYLDDYGQPAATMSAGFTCPSVSGCSVSGTVLAGGCESTDRNLCQGNPAGSIAP